jgi:hypothetical protein
MQSCEFITLLGSAPGRVVARGPGPQVKHRWKVRPSALAVNDHLEQSTKRSELQWFRDRKHRKIIMAKKAKKAKTKTKKRKSGKKAAPARKKKRAAGKSGIGGFTIVSS